MGPLEGYTVIELAGLGPAPMAGMMFADMGADVIRVERSTKLDPMRNCDASFRGKKSIVLNLKAEEGREALFKLVEKADVLIEGFRPGVTEKIGIGPEECMARNPKLVYGRMTGWGQEGPLSQTAGHDINYIAITGALNAIGRPNQNPVAPLNLVGDMGGGGMLLVNGVLAALLEAGKSGKGQVVDAAMVDGTAQLMWMAHGFQALGVWNDANRGINLLDGGAHFYDTFETSDGKYVAIGCIEPQFYAQMLELTGVDKERFADQMNEDLWPELKAELAEKIKTKTRDEWAEIVDGSDACFSPILSLSEAPEHPHNKLRNTYIEVDGFTQPAPAPRFSRTPSEVKHGQHGPGEDSDAVMKQLGYSEADIAALRDENILA